MTRLGIESAPIFVTRGVLLDVEGLKGSPLPRGVEITAADLRACIARQGLPQEDWLGPGDVVLIHTGHGRSFYAEANTWYDSAPGLGLEAAEYLSGFRPSVVGTDNFAVDVAPSVDLDFALPVTSISSYATGSICTRG